MNKKAKNIIVGLILIILLGLVSSVFFPSPVQETFAANWYNASWGYRRAIEVSTAGASATPADYQVLVTLTTAGMGNPYANVNADGSDIRFTNTDGTTLLSHWVESWNNAGDSKIWVKIPEAILADSSKTIYMYYGNALASSVSRGSDTFDYFDNFSPHVNSLAEGFEKYASNPLNLPIYDYNQGAVHPNGLYFPSGEDGYNFWLFYELVDTVPAATEAISLVRSASDGVTFVDTGISNPIIAKGAGGAWDDYMVADPSVLKVGSTWYLYYTGVNAAASHRIGLATSADGKTWTKIADGIGGTSKVLEPNIALPSEAGDMVLGPTVYHDGTKFWMWYTSKHTDGKYKLCLAESLDGKSWTKYAGNPVYSSVLASGVWHSIVAYFNSQYYIYFIRYDGAAYPHIDLIKSSDKTTWTESADNPVLIRREAWEGTNLYAGGLLRDGSGNGVTIDGKAWFYYSRQQAAAPNYAVGLAKTWAGVEENEIDTGKWNFGGATGTWRIDTGTLKASRTNAGFLDLIAKNFALPATGIIEGKWKGDVITSPMIAVYSRFVDIANNCVFGSYQYGVSQRIAVLEGAVYTTDTGIAIAPANNTWYWFKWAEGPSGTYNWTTELGSLSATDPVGFTGKIGLGRYNSAAAERSIWYDDIRVRKFVSTEPAANVGSQVGMSNIQFTLTSSSGAESTTPAQLELTLSAVFEENVTVNYAVTGGTAVGGGTDYTLANGTATITAGNLTTTIDAVIVNDPVDESNETIIVTISSPTNAVLGANTVHTYTIQDNDTAGITVNPTVGLVTSEAGATDTFTVVLDSKPTADVSIGISSSDIIEGTVLPASLTFTAANWNTPQTVTVTGADDAADDGDIAYNILTAAAVSADANYNALNADDVSATNTDNDTAVVVEVAPPGGSVMLPSWSSQPTPPAEGFAVSVNNSGALSTASPIVTLNLRGGSNTEKMAISNTPDFINIGQEPYAQTKIWNLCQGLISCPEGEYTVYVKFYAPWGKSSDVISSKIIYETAAHKEIAAAITTTIKYGQTGPDVIFLQEFLKSQGIEIYPEGIVSGWFGPLTKKAVIRFQEKYAGDILAPWGLTKGTGFVGKSTGAKINEILGR